MGTDKADAAAAALRAFGRMLHSQAEAPAQHAHDAGALQQQAIDAAGAPVGSVDRLAAMLADARAPQACLKAQRRWTVDRQALVVVAVAVDAVLIGRFALLRAQAEQVAQARVAAFGRPLKAVARRGELALQAQGGDPLRWRHIRFVFTH